MAQTKRKRRTKHRGTAAGTVTTRGRTGRPPSPAEKKKLSREQAREARLNTPPSWSGALKRSGFAAVALFVLVLLTSKGRVVSAVLIAILALLIYVPAGYYLELAMYKRRQAKKRQQAAGGK